MVKLLLLAFIWVKSFNCFYYRIGQFISTKAVGKWEREDITSNYKYPESEYKIKHQYTGLSLCCHSSCFQKFLTFSISKIIFLIQEYCLFLKYVYVNSVSENKIFLLLFLWQFIDWLVQSVNFQLHEGFESFHFIQENENRHVKLHSIKQEDQTFLWG